MDPIAACREHDGVITVVDPTGGPDAANYARPITKGAHFRDPWAFSDQAFMAASGKTLVLINGTGERQELVKLPREDSAAGLECHETDEDVMRVFVPGTPVEAGGDQRRICAIAASSAAQVRHLRTSVPTLEDVFARAIGER